MGNKQIWNNLKLIASHTSELGWVKDAITKATAKRISKSKTLGVHWFYFEEVADGVTKWSDEIVVASELLLMSPKELEQHFSALELERQKERKALETKKREEDIKNFQTKYKELKKNG